MATTTAIANKAAWLPTKHSKPFTISDAPTPSPTAHQILIRTRAVAVNPVDAAIQTYGILWPTYPLIIGSDIAGEIVRVGSGVRGLKPGDRVTACVEAGGFQLYCVADEVVVAKIPDGVEFREACVLPLGVTTAAVGLFHPGSMGLEGPRLDGRGNGKIVLVWGGSSSVGSCAIQLVKAAGYEVIATAGAHNSQYCMDLGASVVLDHRSENVVDDISITIEKSGKEFAGVFSAILTPDVIARCADIADRLGKNEKSRTVGTVLPTNMPYNEPLPDGVSLGYCDGLAEILPESRLRDEIGFKMSPNEVAPTVWGAWVGPALAKGILKCKPDADVVGQGLECIQEACDRIAQGVSASKVVVELP